MNLSECSSTLLLELILKNMSRSPLLLLELSVVLLEVRLPLNQNSCRLGVLNYEPSGYWESTVPH
jgi:hypothetical protein